MGVSSMPSPPVLSDFFVRNGERISDLAHEFSGYVVNITETRIRNWIKQFAPEHQELALKLLENVDYYSHDRTIQELSTLGNMIRHATNNELNEVYFAGFTEPGKSGDWIIPDFRLATGMRGHRFQSKFIHLSSLGEFLYIPVEGEPVLPQRTFVFLDDYIGTGESVIRTWARIQGDTNDTDKFYIAAIVATDAGITAVERSTPITVIHNRRIAEDAKLFHFNNVIFTAEEKDILLEYCCTVDPDDWPTGYGDTQSLTVFYQRVSDNVISILNCENNIWKPLFLRDIRRPPH